MGKLLKLKTIINKKNGQCNISIPKKELDADMRKQLLKSKRAIISFEGFE